MAMRSYGGFGEGLTTPVFAEQLNLDTADPLLIAHDRLELALTMAAAFNEDERPHKGDYLRQQFADFEKAMEGVDGYQGVFGTGYPFYAWDSQGGVHAVEEISSYTESYKPWIRADRVRNLGMWPCAACQRDRQLPDLKKECKPCELVSYKPRDLFKVLPDVDFWVVVDEVNPEVEQDVEAAVRSSGFYTSDEAIKPALITTMSVMDAIRRGGIPEERLPVDLHIVTVAELSQAMARVIEELGRDDEPGFIPISPRSLHVQWEQPDLPYDFLKDFLFSFTTSGWRNDQLIDQLATTREQARAILKGNAVSRVASLSSVAARQLQTRHLRQNLEDRVAGW